MGGRKQPQPFDAARAELLDDPERERWLPTATIVAMLDVRDGARILDYGTGTGRYALAVARAYPASEIVAFDIQQRMLDIVRQRIADSDLYNIRTAGPYASNVSPPGFDRVLAVHLLHEIDDEHLLQIRRMLAPDGRLLIVDWDRDAKRDFGPPPDHVHTPAEALDRLARTGFAPRVLDSPAFPYHFVIAATKLTSPPLPAG
jgi:ubiquinone/menaquinone biosynthesis C-methylase UbiE